MSAHASLPVGSADVLPRLAAMAWPDRAALRAGARTVTFAELDRAVSRLAFGLRQRIGGDGLTVAVAALPGLDFPTAFYAIIRSGNVAAPISPTLDGPELVDYLRAVQARAVILGRAQYDRVRDDLPSTLELVLLLDAPAWTRMLTCAELSTGGTLLVEPRDRDEREPAVIASGLLTHHELKVRAAAYGLSAAAVVLNTSPAYDVTHLSAALLAGATQVLTRHPDQAQRSAATHVLPAAS